MREFEGHVLFIEGYDLRLARRLVSGVDVWLNNPVYPLEASGTSGMKAGFNGAINLSVLDGWWGEGYRGDNGWAIKPASEVLDAQRRDLEESRSLFELLQDRVIPLYYDRGAMGFSPEWVQMAKRSIMTLLPRFNSQRMVGEYLERFYGPAAGRHRHFAQDRHALARELAQWKDRVRRAWHNVSLHALEVPRREAAYGDKLRFGVLVRLDGLEAGDIAVELLAASRYGDGPGREEASFALRAEGARDANGEQRYVVELAPELCGKLELRIRAYPFHEALTHRFEMGLMKWA